MASTVLPNGIIAPEKFSRDWYADLYHNWQELDNLLGGGTPKDGTLTIQKNGNTVGTFSANQATDETINITVPDVNNGTLTIQQNGSDVATFTSNASSNVTCNITVPTNTIQLTNGNGFITSEIDSMGTGWVRFKCGLQICWGTKAITWSTQEEQITISFAKSFIGSVTVSLSHSRIGYTLVSFSLIRTFNNSNFVANYVSSSSTNPAGMLLWLAIGKWK